MPVISAWLFTAYFHLLKCPAPRVSPGHPICEAFCIWPLVTAQLPLFYPCSLSWTRLSGDSLQVPDGPQGLCTGSCPPCCFPQKLCVSLPHFFQTFTQWSLCSPSYDHILSRRENLHQNLTKPLLVLGALGTRSIKQTLPSQPEQWRVSISAPVC